MHNIYFFNPTGEMAIANGTISYMPPRKLQIFEEDLAFLPSFFAHEGDTIVTPHKPDLSFVKQWQQLGLPSLTYTPFKELEAVNSFGYLRPWSWNQAIHYKCKSIKSQGSEAFKHSPNYSWDTGHKDFFSRQTTNLIQSHIQGSCTVHIPHSAIKISSIEQFDNWIKNQTSAIIKMPWSSSGRGIHIIHPKKNKPINYPWLKGAIKQQGYVTAEPLLNKKFDFSFQLYLRKDGTLDLLGISYFINDSKGHFTGGYINWPHQQSYISQFLNDETLQDAANRLISGIKKVSPERYYEGPLGVDAIVYKDEKEQLKIHPCVDINWRYNMGMVNISLNKFISSNSKGIWKVQSFKPETWNTFITDQQRKKPLIINNNKISSGFIPMTPPSATAHFGVWMDVWQ
jgi:hypothetical protein